MPERYAVTIVGAGPAGLAAGVAAAQRGLSHVVLDRGVLANTVHLYQRGKHVMAEPERLPLHGELPLRFEAASREQVLEAWEQDARKAGVHLELGPEFEVVSVEGQKGEFVLGLKRGDRILCENLVLAIGVQGNLRRFGVPGDDLPHVVHQLDDPAEHAGRRVVVVGVGDAGLENALALAENEAQVTVVNRRDEFDRAKARNRALIEAAIRAGQIQYLPNTTVERFLPQKVVLASPQGELTLDVDLVIGRLGAVPPRRFLEGLGIEFPSKDPAAVPAVSEAYECSVPGIHLVGAVVGYPLIKNCMNQGFEVIERLLGRPVIPADEPLLEEKFAALQGTVSEIIDRIRQRVPLFANLTPIQLREFLVGSDIRRLGASEIVFRRNDFTDTFFSIVDGGVSVTLPGADDDRDLDRTSEGAEERSFRLGTGDFFGEGSLISGRRRSATIETLGPCELIETPRSAMNALIHSSADVKRVLDTTFIERRIENTLPKVPPEERRRLAEQASSRTYKQGEVLFQEGDAPDGLHLIRRGAVTITRRLGNRDVVLNYVQAGNYIGEIALVAPDSKRSATVRAAVLTESILLPTEVMVDFLRMHPELRSEFERQEQIQRERDVHVAANPRATDLVAFLLDVGLAEATDLLLIDESLCIRCDNCEKACAETHAGVSRLDREGGPYYGAIHVPTACQHCENPKCMDDCPPDALRRHATGEVYIMDNCIGCGNCVANCPYNVIQLAVVRERRPRGPLWDLLFGTRSVAEPAGEGAEKLAVKCDLCRKLPANAGLKGGAQHYAACVASCPTGAIVRIKPKPLIEEIQGAQT